MKETILETLNMPSGIGVDIDEGWHKIISRQFGGDAGRGFGELIQNLIDSYDAVIPLEDRRGTIETDDRTISITDYGSGLDLEKISLLTTLGGTDKNKDADKIGAFGVGFFSIFNPKLATRQVRVITQCERHTVVELVFRVEDQQKPPILHCDVHKKSLRYSTRVEVTFDRIQSVDQCLEAAKKALKYYPCKITINGELFHSIWEKAKQSDAYQFSTDLIQGFLVPSDYQSRVIVLCKYEFIMNMSIYGFLTGGHRSKYSIDDLYPDRIPYLPNFRLYLNCNTLNVTISRDSFYLNLTWRQIKKELSPILLDYLDSFLDWKSDIAYSIINQYIFRNEINRYLKDADSTDVKPVIKKLARARVYQLNNRPGNYSLYDIKKQLSENVPLFFSPQHQNLRWLGGNFRHDFIVLPPKHTTAHYIPGFFDKLFQTIFHDSINLDTIQSNNDKLKDLVQREIISKNALAPDFRIVGEQELTPEQQCFLDELQTLLDKPAIKSCIESNIHIPIKTIRIVLMAMNNDNVTISSGILDHRGKPVDDEFVSNFIQDDGNQQKSRHAPVNVFLGLSLHHPFVQHLMLTQNPCRAYYSLTFIAHELALSQQLLSPYSRFFHMVKEKLANDMRKALIGEITRDELTDERN